MLQPYFLLFFLLLLGISPGSAVYLKRSASPVVKPSEPQLPVVDLGYVVHQASLIEVCLRQPGLNLPSSTNVL
jgi:hypothetical protein